MSDVSMSATGGGETQSDPSGWTTDTLRHHMQQRFDDVYRALQERDLRYEQRFQAEQAATHKSHEAIRAEMRLALEASKEAIAKADAANEKRFEGVNEFRAQLADQASTFMNRNESIQRHDSTAERIAAIEKRLTESLATVNSRLDLAAGRGAGLEKGWGYIVAAIGAVGVVITIIYALSTG